ncbi:Fanconi anemia group A protein isoform X3 [Stigmatopora argus]
MEELPDLCSLFKEVENPHPSYPFNTGYDKQREVASESIRLVHAGSLLVYGLRHQAMHLCVPLPTLSAKLVLERLKVITRIDDNNSNGLLTSSQREQLHILLISLGELFSHGVLSPKALWQEYRKNEKLPNLHVVYLFQFYNTLELKDIIESDEGVSLWLVPQLKALCSWIPQEKNAATEAQMEVLSTLLRWLINLSFHSSQEPEVAVEKRCILLCISTLDDMLFWVLDAADTNSAQSFSETAPERWCQLLDTSLCKVLGAPDVLQRFLKHCLTQTLTYKPQLAVSDAIAQQNKWSFAKASPLLISLFSKMTVIFSVKQLLQHLQQILESHEVSWKHVLCFLSTLLVYNPSAQHNLRELLSGLLTSAFERYDLESIITAFLLARHGALHGPSTFPSYSDWFKESFGSASCFHSTSKKSLMFLLKFLSDLVPFEPQQYLKIHILHPPYVPMKYHSLLKEYVSLAKTRLADLKESLQKMGLDEIVSCAEDASVKFQTAQDVERASSLFEITGKISSVVMEASIFRRAYFLTQFLPALMKPRLLPLKADAQMNFIEALKRAGKIPAAQYSLYLDSCQRLRQQEGKAVYEENYDDPLPLLKVQLQEQRRLIFNGKDGDLLAQMSKISQTLSFIFPCLPDDLLEKKVIKLNTVTILMPELHLQVVDEILKNFSQCIMDASKTLPPNRQIIWASGFVSILLCNTHLVSCLLHRVWHLLHHQGSMLSCPQVVGLAAFVVHLNASMFPNHVVQLTSPRQPSNPVSVSEALCSALVCNTDTCMYFCFRFCVAAMSYVIYIGDSLPHKEEMTPSIIYKKLQYLIPRLLPETRMNIFDGKEDQDQDLNRRGLWNNVIYAANKWKKTALRLWKHSTFLRLQRHPLYQLCFTEWLANELQVQRSRDTLSDSERLVYHEWVCMQLYLSRSDDQGGCGGSLMSLCSHLINAIMDQQQRVILLEDYTVSQKGTCLPEIICTLQKVIYELELSGSQPSRMHICDVLFEMVSQRFSASLSSASAHLNCEITLNTWNRVMLALQSMSFIKVQVEGDRIYLDCKILIQHVSDHQRTAWSTNGLLSFELTSHFLRSILCGSARCSNVAEEFNKIWSEISHHCPLLLVSTVLWWEQLSEVLLSLWRRLRFGESPPEQLQLINTSRSWACSLMRGLLLQMPSAPALLFASSLYAVLQGCEQDVRAALTMLQPERDIKHKEVLVFLLFLSLNSYVSALLHPQERCHQKALQLCTEVLTLLLNSADWLLIFNFKDAEKCGYPSLTLVTSDRFTQLLPWLFYNLLLQQNLEIQQKAVRCPGFLSTAVSCYISLLQHFLDGPSMTGTLESQIDFCQILCSSKTFLLKAISQTSPSTLFSSTITQLKTLCVEFDPEVAEALSTQFNPHRKISELPLI